jgi:hypothetical protein
VQVAKRVPEGVVCLLTTLRFHNLTDQNPSKVWLAIDRKASPVKTVADCPKYRNKIGTDVAVQALRDYRRRRRSIDDLLEAARFCRVERTPPRVPGGHEVKRKKGDAPTNVAASVKARLLQRAREDGEDFNSLQVRYVLERLLYRLGTSQHAGKFVLKSALLFVVWSARPHRATKDPRQEPVDKAELRGPARRPLRL